MAELALVALLGGNHHAPHDLVDFLQGLAPGFPKSWIARRQQRDEFQDQGFVFFAIEVPVLINAHEGRGKLGF
ncbi:hypothetical protein D9M71_784520 [compost metagenome]